MDADDWKPPSWWKPWSDFPGLLAATRHTVARLGDDGTGRGWSARVQESGGHAAWGKVWLPGLRALDLDERQEGRDVGGSDARGGR